MPNPSPFATNAFGVQTSSIDFTDPGSPTSMTYHGLAIVVQGNIVGRFTSWNPEGAYNRDGEHVYELNRVTMGKPVDYIPGKATGFTVSYGRTEVWDQELERTLGYPAAWADLTDQNRPFVSQEFLYKGTDPYRVWQYSGCWFRSKNPEGWTADGNYIYRVSGQIAYVSRIRVL
jgi:hypothetical protein